MSHQVAIVAIPSGADVDEYLDEVMAQGGGDDKYENSPHLQWDWYVTGGRWSGSFFKDGEDVGVKADLDRDRKVYTFIDESGKPLSTETYSAEDKFVDTEGFDERYREFLDRIPDDMRLVVVDYHD